MPQPRISCPIPSCWTQWVKLHSCSDAEPASLGSCLKTLHAGAVCQHVTQHAGARISGWVKHPWLRCNRQGGKEPVPELISNRRPQKLPMSLLIGSTWASDPDGPALQGRVAELLMLSRHSQSK